MSWPTRDDVNLFIDQLVAGAGDRGIDTKDVGMAVLMLCEMYLNAQMIRRFAAGEYEVIGYDGETCCVRWRNVTGEGATDGGT